MQKVLFLIPSLTMGGAERVTSHLANHLANKGYQVAISTLTDTSADFYALDPRIERFGLGVSKSSDNIGAAIVNNVNTIGAVRNCLREWQPHVAISMMSSANVYLAFAGRGLPIQKIGSERVHPPNLPLGRAWEFLRRVMYGNLNGLVAQTEQSASWLKANTRIKHVTVIGNPVVLPLPSVPPIEDPAALLNSRRKYILAIGRLVDQKGFDLLIDAYARLALSSSRWDLVILGDGPMKPELEAKIHRYDLMDRVLLPGRVGNPGDWYQACDMYVMSSRFEGFPNTLAEAMSYSLPVVSFDCPTGPSDLISNGDNGLLIPNGDTEGLADAITRLTTDKSLRKKLGETAAKIRERLDIDHVSTMWEGLFGEMANGG